MDIFTILVLFLIVNASTEEAITAPKDVSLPLSYAEHKPKPNITITVNDSNITVQGKKIVNVRNISASNTIIPELQRELDRYTQSIEDEDKRKILKKRGVTVLGDKDIPFVLLKQIMKTCAESDYTNVSLAVEQRKAGP